MPEIQQFDTHVINRFIATAVADRGAQKQLANRLGVRAQTVNKWVKGENTPPPGQWPLIEDALGVPRNTMWQLVMREDVRLLGLTPEPRVISLAAELDQLAEKINAVPSGQHKALEAAIDSILAGEPMTIAAKQNPGVVTDPARARATARKASRRQVDPGEPA